MKEKIKVNCVCKVCFFSFIVLSFMILSPCDSRFCVCILSSVKNARSL